MIPPREQHLMDMLDRALELIDVLKERAQQAELKAAAFVALEERLARIERVLSKPTAATAAAWREDGSADPAIRAALASGPKTASAVARLVYQTRGAAATNSERSNIRSMLQRMVRDGEVIFDSVGKTYRLVEGHAETSNKGSHNGQQPRSPGAGLRAEGGPDADAEREAAGPAPGVPGRTADTMAR